MYHQVIGTAMGTIFAPAYACLVIGFLEETILVPVLLPLTLEPSACQNIIKQFYRYMDDGVILLPDIPDENVFLDLLNSMHPSIQYTIGKPKLVFENGQTIQSLCFLALVLYLNSDGSTWTDVFYKETNSHDYLGYKSHHPEHVKKNIPFFWLNEF